MSTQTLTELPRIQKTGMDFESVVEEIQNIIADNPNWRSNWNEFRDSEAGAMLIELFAWITDNFTTRQDLLFNEMFIGTAQDDKDKIRHLKQIGYIPKMPHPAKVPIRVTFSQAAETDSARDKIIITKSNGNENLISRPSAIASFKSSDINGVNGEGIYWEIIKMRDGKPDYLEEVILNPGKIEYEKDSYGDDIYAFQGKTKCEEFQISTKNGSFFTLKEKNIASDSIQVYIQDTYEKLLQVKSFISSEALDENNPIPYVVELNEDRTYNIRFANKDIAKDSRLIKAGKTIFVFYRTCDGEIGNIKPGIISTSLNCTTTNGKSMICQITNDFPAVGGSNVEKLTDAVMNGPLSLTTMDRAVTPDDYNIILRNNTNVYKAKTYTSSNQPKGFKDYYGRFINPQESFTFLMTKKNHKGVPTEKYNSFPWFTTIKEPRINEKYIFDEGKFNEKTNIKGKSYNLQITEPDRGTHTFNNAIVIDIGELFNNELYVDSEGNKIKNDQLELKLNTEVSDKLFLNEVPFGIFSQDSLLPSIKMNTPEVIYNDNAQFITKDVIDLKEPIDIKGARYLSFEMDNGAFEAVKIDLADGVKNIDQLEHYYLLWDNKIQEEPSNLPQDGKEISKYRLGIVQIINKSINNAVSNATEFGRNAGISKQPFGLKKGINETINIIDDYFSLQFSTEKINKVTYIFNKPDGSLDLIGLKDYLNECFTSGTNVKKYNNNTLEELSMEDKEFLKMYSIDTYKFRNTSNISGDSVFVMDNISDASPEKCDIYICSDKPEALKNYEYTDSQNIQYSVEKAVDVEDPLTDSLINIDGGVKNIRGLFQILSNSSKSINRDNRNIPNVYPECVYESLAGIIGEENNKRFFIKSPLKGPISSLCFKSESDSVSDFSKNILKIPFDKEGTESYKAIGQKKAYMLLKDPIIIQNIFNGKPVNNRSLDIKKGNIIFENSCLFNDYYFRDVFASYKLKNLDRIELGSTYDNFYFTGDKLKDEKLKSDIKGILGQRVTSTKVNDKDIYYIDEDRSNYNIKLTKDHKDTNSLFAIEDNLGAVCKNYVNLKSDRLSKIELLDYDFKLRIDDNEIVTLNINNLASVQNGYSFIKILENACANAVASNEPGAVYIRDNLNSIFKEYYKDEDKIIISSISKYDGNVILYNSENEEKDKKFYKWLFGTNKTNDDFYKLHNYIGEENRISVGEDEYFYCPKLEKPLGFQFRTMIREKNGDLISKGADYTIETVQNDDGTCMFYLKKEEGGHFPDSYFYVHFINDKSYDFNEKGLLNETDESIFQKYMSKSKISGTDITFLQPYFKTYDIEATVGYNSDFTSAAEIKSKIEKAIDKLCGLENAQIGGKITKSEINYIIRSCEGVADLTIDYLGYNALDKANNEDLEYILSPFYSINCIHETTEDGRGLNLKLKSI